MFVIDSETTENTEDLLKHVRRVVGYVARENCVAPRSGPLGFQRCLFYQDDQGRLFNLVLSKHTIGPASTWLQYLDSFSGSQAMMALTVLCRSFPCIANGTPAPSLSLRLFLRIPTILVSRCFSQQLQRFRTFVPLIFRLFSVWR